MDIEAQRRWGKIGGLTAYARHGNAITAPARRAFEARFYAGLDGVPEPERTRRAAAARRVFFQRLTESSRRARQRRHGPAEPAAASRPAGTR